MKQSKPKQKTYNPRKGHNNIKCEPKVVDERKVSRAINDPSYYFTNDTLKNQLTNVSFNDFTGVVDLVPTTFDGALEEENIPYAMRINLNPSAGFTTPEGDATMGNALNLASLALYTQLTANNAKTSNYAPQDVTTLMLATGSVISLASHIMRAFGLTYTYNQRNRAYPKAMVEVAGVDYDDLVDNFANYRNKFNTIMVSASKLPIPRNVTYFSKCSELYSGVYLDMAGSDMAQSYVFTPRSVWMLDETGSEEGSVLRPFIITPSTAETVTMSVLLHNLNIMISSLLSSSTLNAIYSDILRLATKEGLPLYQFAVLPDNYIVLPQYVPEVRLWINNLTVMGEPLTEVEEGYTSGNIVLPDVDTNKIIYRPQFRVPATRAAALREPYINFDNGYPTNDEIISATRLCSTGKYHIVGDYFVTEYAALPDHYVTGIAIFVPNGEHSYTTNPYIFGVLQQVRFTSFDWSPIMRSVDADGTYAGVFGDLNYYTNVSYNFLSKLHDATYLGLFEVR